MSPTAPSEFRRCFWDIEVSPNVGFFWSPGPKVSIRPESIIKERAIICICWKWEGEDEVHALTWDRKQSDRAMLKAFLAAVADADELVHHNGDRFDLPWFRARCVFHGVLSFPQWKTADTLAWARRLYRFNNNTLDYLAKFLGVGGKASSGFKLWEDITLRNCPDALEKMVAYCKQDVRILEKVWSKLRFASPVKTHIGAWYGRAKWTCPHDGSTNVKTHRRRVSAAGGIYYQMRCKDCGSFYSINTKAHQDYLKARTVKTAATR